MGGIRSAMGELRWRIEENQLERKAETVRRAKPPRFAPAGQSTQMIVGADDADDRSILDTSHNLYGNYRMRRVYYSAFSPIPDASSKLPLQAPPLQREHRLYQADWLLRFYEFSVEEIAPAQSSGMLDLDVDPKLAWALRNPERFPVDLNAAPREMLLRVPGLGTRNVERLLLSRRHARLRVGDLARLRVPMKKSCCRSSACSIIIRANGWTIRSGCVRSWRQRRGRRACSTDLPCSALRWNHRGVFEAWRALARAGWCAQAEPDDVAWNGGAQGGLLMGQGLLELPAVVPPPRVSADFMQLAASVLCHRDPQRHAVLYRLLWRVACGEKALLERATDVDVHRLRQWQKAVQRDTHKMKAFVRFRRLPGEEEDFVAWFEPEHWIVDRVAPFFSHAVLPACAGRS